MRPLSRLALLGTVAATAIAAPSALAAPTMTATLSPNKGGTLTVGAPTSFKITAATPDTVVDATGAQRLQSITAKLPLQMLFNTVPFSTCRIASFLASHTCPSSTKLGTTKIVADGGPSVGAPINATADLYFGDGYSVLARVQATNPAVIDEAVIGSLRSSNTAGYGLEMYIPVSKTVQEPLPGLFPVVKSISAVVTPPTKSVKVPGETKKVKLPLAGLAPCKGALNFRIDVNYTNAAADTPAGNSITRTDTATTKAKCKK